MRRKQQGFSLIEVTVVLAIVSVLMIGIYTMIEETMRMTMFNESHNDLAVMSQQAVNTLQSEILQTKMVFQEDTLGTSYRGALNLPAAYPVMTDSFLPVIQPAVDVTPDSATRFTGNSLLIARQLEPIAVNYDHDADVNTAEIEFLADRYRFEYIYLTPLSSPSFAGSGQTLDLIMTISIEYADFFQLNALSANAIARITTALRNRGLSRAWNPGQPMASAFYTLSGASDGVFNAAVNNPRIDLARSKSLLPGLRGGRISGRIHYSVAFVPAAPRPAYPLRIPIRQFAIPINGRPAFPSGFEVKVAGPSGNRQVMTRLVLMSNYAAKTYESQQGFVTTAARF